MTVPAAPGVTCEVLIVGGGPTGLFLAALLARRGVDVRVLERRTAPAEHSRAIGLHPPALAALQEVGLDGAAVAAGVRIRTGRARSRGQDLGRVRFERAWPERPFVLSLPQGRTEDLLEQRLAASAPGALRRGWTVSDVREHEDGVEVTARRTTADQPDRTARAAAGGESDGNVLRLGAQVVVGADGAHSRVRDLLGIATTGTQHPDTYLMGDLADPLGAAGERDAIIHLEPEGVVESFPLPGGRRRWVVHTGPSLSADPSPTVLVALIRARTGAASDAATSSMISAFTVRRRAARRLVTARGVLIGDAAHEISPIGGQGITLGWLDALDLAPLLAAEVAGARRGPLSADPAWRRFERACGRRARVGGLLAHANTALGRPLPPPLAAARAGAVRVALHTPLQRVLAWAYSMGWVRGLPRALRGPAA